MPRTLCIALMFCLFTSMAAADQDSDLPPIKAVKDAKPQASAFDAASRDKPLVIRSEDDAAKHFSEDDLAMLKNQVDFDKQFVLVFAWKGSGQDRLDYEVLESFPEQIVFKYKPGLTRDLRPHVHTYVLRSNVKWRMAK